VSKLRSQALFDLSSESNFELPLALIAQWESSAKTNDTHEHLLAPFKVAGTLVCTDSANLTSLSLSLELVDVMRLISQPKEVLFNFASALNGTPIGTWYADNTRTFFDEKIDCSDIIRHFVAAQNEIAKLTVQVGICIHSGTFIFIENQIHGTDNDFCSMIAEDHCHAEEIILTEFTAQKYAKELSLELREDLKFEQKLFRLNYKNNYKAPFEKFQIDNSQGHYPLPFDLEFYQDLKIDGVHELGKRLHVDKIVVLFYVTQMPSQFLLERFSQMAQTNLLVESLDKVDAIEKIKSNGQLGIFVSDDAAEALKFARDISSLFVENGLKNSVAIAKGDVLIFQLDVHRKEIAGNPVNIASKLAEDLPADNSIYVHESVTLNQTGLDNVEKISVEISGVTLVAYKIKI